MCRHYVAIFCLFVTRRFSFGSKFKEYLAENLWMGNAFPPEDVARFDRLIMDIVMVFFGLYRWGFIAIIDLHWHQCNLDHSWEFLVSLWLEYKLLTGRLSFKWPLVRLSHLHHHSSIWHDHSQIPYFIARYGCLIAIITEWVSNYVLADTHSSLPKSVAFNATRSPIKCSSKALIWICTLHF